MTFTALEDGDASVTPAVGAMPMLLIISISSRSSVTKKGSMYL